MTDKSAGKAIYMSLKQLLIIFYQRKLKGIPMPSEMEDITADDRMLKTSMVKMIADGILVPGEGDRFCLSPEAKEIVDIIVGAEKIYYVADSETLPCFIYRIGEMAVALSIDSKTGDGARLEMMDIRSAFETLCDYPDMPLGDEEAEIAPSEPYELSVTMEELVNQADVCLVTDVFAQGDTSPRSRFVVRFTPEGTFVERTDAKGSSSFSYKKEQFVQALMEDK